jgi:hypothetical protein
LDKTKSAKPLSDIHVQLYAGSPLSKYKKITGLTELFFNIFRTINLKEMEITKNVNQGLKSKLCGLLCNMIKL